jgi:hypothetical protein
MVPRLIKAQAATKNPHHTHNEEGAISAPFLFETTWRILMKQLDKNRPYGTCHPPHGEAMYDQDGKLFAIDGALCDADGVRIVPEPEGVAQNSPDVVIPPSVAATQPEVQEDESIDVDVAAWAQRTKNYHWFTVRAAIKAKYDAEFTTAEDARAFLLNLPLE